MIQVLFLQSNHSMVGFQISGHAGYEAYGKDIVCSAVSVLAETCINAIEAIANQKPMQFAVEEKEGFMYFRLENPNEKATVLLEAFQIGISGVEESYGKYVEIGLKEVES